MSSDSTPGRPLRMYTAQNKHIDLSTETIVGSKINNYKNWKCGLGVENIYIDMDGKIFGASCRLGGELGTIFDDVRIPQEWLTCSRDLCTCGADLFIPKSKTTDDKRHLLKTFPQSASNIRSTASAQIADSFVAMERTHDAHLKQVYWEIGRWCNYDCSYCWPFIHNKTDPHKSLEQLIRATMLIDEKFAQGKQCHFVISGGEPTMNPALMDWVKFIFSLGHKISMHSNGSRLPKYYQELIHYTNLNISVHFEFYKPEKLIEVISALAQEKYASKNKGVGHLEVKLMMPPGKTLEVLDFEKAVFSTPHFKSYCTLAIVPIRDGTVGDLVKEGYSTDDFKLFGDRLSLA